MSVRMSVHMSAIPRCCLPGFLDVRRRDLFACPHSKLIHEASSLYDKKRKKADMATATASDTETLTTAESDAAVGVDDTHVDIVPISKQATAGKPLRFLGVYALTRPRGWTDAQLDALRRTCESSPSPSISTSTVSSTTGFAFEDAASQSSSVSSLYAGAPSGSRDNRVKAASSGHDKAIEVSRQKYSAVH